MFKVTLINLSPDGSVADLSFGTEPLGELDEGQFANLLESFRNLDPLQNSAAEPEISVENRRGKFIIRTGQAKLFLYDASDNAAPYSELSTEEIIRQLTSTPLTAAPWDASSPAAAPARTPHRGIAITMLIAGLALNGYTLYSVFYVDDVNKKPAIVLITDATELTARQNSVVGRYATGNESGDRVIIVGADGRIHFSEIRANDSKPESTDTYQIGRYGEQLCLITPESGVIDITNLTTLTYYRDIYRRTK